MINFKANYVSPTYIKDTYRNSNKQDCKVSLVEVNPNSQADLSAIHDIALNWGKRDTYAVNIMENLFYSHYCEDFSGKRFFALTKQPNNFEKLKGEEVLGLAMVITNDTKEVRLEYLQVEPENNYFSIERRYKGIGSSLLHSICDIFKNRDISLCSAKSAIEFYKSQGFKQINETMYFILKR